LNSPEASLLGDSRERRYRVGRYGATPILATEEFAEAALNAAGGRRRVQSIDEHPYVDQAMQLAASSWISIAVTNPCIELWFLLHFRDQTAGLHRQKTQEISSDLLGCVKVPPPVLSSSSSAAMRMPGGARGHLTRSTRWTAHRRDRTRAAACGALSTRSEGLDAPDGDVERGAGSGEIRVRYKRDITLPKWQCTFGLQ
jgi:RloB-like protein